MIACLDCIGRAPASSQQLDGGLAAGCGWPFRRLTRWLVRALPVVVPATRCGVCRLPFVKPRVV